MPYSRKYKQKALIMQNLHKVLSRIDVEKDALYADTPIRKESMIFFHQCANKLFGELPIVEYKRGSITEHILKESLAKSTSDFLQTLKKYNAYRPKQVILEMEKYTDLFSKFASIAPEIDEAIHDAGRSPYKYKPTINVILNPGSYLDPGN